MKKRRVIWLSDLQWETLQGEASKRGLNLSQTIGEWLDRVGRHPEGTATVEPPLPFRPVPKPGQK